MTGYFLRYQPGTKFGELLPTIRIPAHGLIPTLEQAEAIRDVPGGTGQLEVVPIEDIQEIP